jgi:16S rRNA (adenine1518-N6/adenine1519-N6)-dimethyltransferase
MLRQSMKTLSANSDAIIREAGIAPTERPERLTVAEFASLARAYRNQAR